MSTYLTALRRACERATQAQTSDERSLRDDDLAFLLSPERVLALIHCATALRSLEQAYANKHSPQHRAASLAEAQAALSAIDASEG